MQLNSKQDHLDLWTAYNLAIPLWTVLKSLPKKKKKRFEANLHFLDFSPSIYTQKYIFLLQSIVLKSKKGVKIPCTYLFR